MAMVLQHYYMTLRVQQSSMNGYLLKLHWFLLLHATKATANMTHETANALIMIVHCILFSIKKQYVWLPYTSSYSG